jgi:hypothetical protein
MAKHSPSPWYVADDVEAGGVPLIPLRCDGHRTVAEICASFVNEGDVDFAITDQDRANARLIAAAPDLLLAAKDAAVTLANMVEAVRGDPRRSPCIMRLMEVVAKAEGRS